MKRSVPSSSLPSLPVSLLTSLTSLSPFAFTLSRSLHVVRTIEEFRRIRSHLSLSPTNSVGFVPTMGALHDGHLDLVRHSKQQNSHTIVSIFVNPTQFAPHEDLSRYPRPFESDCSKLRSEGVDYLFHPSVEEMYPNGLKDHLTYVNVEGMEHRTQEGRSRPTHFKGVSTVVSKLFNVVEPHSAFFGQKDGVQCIVVRKMVRDLNIPIHIHIVPTRRDIDGLAMSSRNVYLSPTERATAPIIYQALRTAEERWRETGGKENVGDLKRTVESVLRSKEKEGLSVEYVSVSNMNNGEELSDESVVLQSNAAMISVACKLGKTRLIDNVVLRSE